MGWLMGFEPTYERVTVVSVNRFTTATINYFGTPERIRTSDLRIRSPLLYPTELQAQSLVGVRGFEPPTPCSQGRCASQAALHPVETQIFTILTKLLQPIFVLKVKSPGSPGIDGTFKAASMSGELNISAAGRLSVLQKLSRDG